jgi:hypothetical protein
VTIRDHPLRIGVIADRNQLCHREPTLAPSNAYAFQLRPTGVRGLYEQRKQALASQRRETRRAARPSEVRRIAAAPAANAC